MRILFTEGIINIKKEESKKSLKKSKETRREVIGNII